MRSTAPTFRPAGFSLRAPARRPASMTALLTGRLGDLLATQGQCREAHWDLSGPELAGLRRSLFAIWGSMEKCGDLLAGRMAQLADAGDVPAGRALSGRSALDDAPLTPYSAEEHLTNLRGSLEAIGTRLRSAIRAAREMGDMESAVICAEVARATTAARRIVAASLAERRIECR